MKNILTFLVITITIFSCSSSSNDDNPEPDSTMLLKQIQWNTGYGEKYFYNNADKLEMIIKNDGAFINEDNNDSTFIEYANGNISRILEREHDPGVVVNVEETFDTFGANSATGTIKVFTDAGAVYSEHTFEYMFSGNLLKSYTRFNLNGNVHFFQEFEHDANGNLIEWVEISYNSETGEIIYDYDDEITQWDEDKQVTETLFSWDAVLLPGFYLSNNNCLDLITENTTYSYSFEYNAQGYVTKYMISDGNFFDLEYY